MLTIFKVNKVHLAALYRLDQSIVCVIYKKKSDDSGEVNLIRSLIVIK